MAKHKKKPAKPGPFGITWSQGPQGPITDFLGGAPKKPIFPKSGVGVRPPRRKKVVKPKAEIRHRKVLGGVHVRESRIGGEPIEREGRAHVLPRYWSPSTDIPTECYIPSDSHLPPQVEAIIHLEQNTDGMNPYMRATAHQPDHRYDAALDYYRCNHSRAASSWVSCIGLVILESGELSIYCQFWDGAEIAYLFQDGDDAIAGYNWWKAQPSAGKAIRGKFGPSRWWNWPYVRLSG